MKGDDSRRITKVRSEVKMFFIFSHRNDFFYSCDVAFSFRDEIFYLVLVECLVRQSNRDESTLMRIEVFCEGGDKISPFCRSEGKGILKMDRTVLVTIVFFSKFASDMLYLV